MTPEKKQRITVHIQPDTIRKMDRTIEDKDFSNRNELICEAVNFYVEYLNATDLDKYISKTLLTKNKKMLERLEGRICKQLFRLAVEISISAHVSASRACIPPENFEKIRERCIADVQKSLGTVYYDSIYGFQHYLDKQED